MCANFEEPVSIQSFLKRFKFPLRLLCNFSKGPNLSHPRPYPELRTFAKLTNLAARHIIPVSIAHQD